MDYIISIEGNLTSFAFYDTIVKKMHEYFELELEDQIVFDFSAAKWIDALVLPNLLCVGYWIQKERRLPAIFFVPGSQEFANMRTYLNNIGFVRIAEQYGLFEFDENIFCGLNDKVFADSVNQIEVFELSLTDQKPWNIDQEKKLIWEKLKQTLLKFITTFLGDVDTRDLSINKGSLSSTLLLFGRELIENALLHGRSFCFLAMQYNPKSKKQIRISVGDCGIGFKRSINFDRNRALKILELQKPFDVKFREQAEVKFWEERKKCEDMIRHIQESGLALNDEDISRLSGYPYIETELQGIVYGLMSRKKDPSYGLYGICEHAFKRDGVIRIHSNDTQVILTERMALPLNASAGPQGLVKILLDERYHDQNLKRGIKFKGTHIEIEMMLREVREEKNYV